MDSVACLCQHENTRRETHVPCSGDDVLDSLCLAKGYSELLISVLQTPDTSPKQEMGSSIQCVPEEQITNVDLPALTSVPFLASFINLVHQYLNVLLKYF